MAWPNQLWSEPGTFGLKVKSKDIHGFQSDWSNIQSITMPRTRSDRNHFIYKLIEKLIDLIPPVLIDMFLLLT